MNGAGGGGAGGGPDGESGGGAAGGGAGGGPVGEWGSGDWPPPGLPVERTGLAWARTGLTVCAVALALSRVADLRDRPGPAVVALLAASVGLAAVVVGGVRASSRHPTRGGGAPVLPWTARWLVGAVVILALAGAWLAVGQRWAP